MSVWVDSIQGGCGHCGVWTKYKVGRIMSVWAEYKVGRIVLVYGLNTSG